MTAAIRIWGKVEIDTPPYRASAKRLSVDARFLNLWMKDSPFSFDKLVDAPRRVYHGSFMMKCDDKSGDDHVSVRYFSDLWALNGWGSGLYEHLAGKSLHTFTKPSAWLHLDVCEHMVYHIRTHCASTIVLTENFDI